ncbi:MAG: sulfite exporter TauE/SafE family protein, partial [Treponema sp.]|nr:sulfite exporter TauE/SafE family protein [Treponema sp.]
LVLIVFTVEFVCFFIKGLAAFGDPLISNPALSMITENKIISLMNLLLGTPINAYMTWKNRKKFSLKNALFMLIFILCGIIPGTLLLKYASSWILKAGLGIVVLGIGIEMMTRNRAKPVRQNRIIMAIISFCSGITAGLYGINLFFVAYIERTTQDRAAFRGNLGFIFFVENVIRIIIYAVLGIFTKDILLLTLIAFPGAVFGFLSGSGIDKRLSETVIRRIIIFMFMLGGISLFLKAIILKA